MATHLIIFFFCLFWILPSTHVLAGFQACLPTGRDLYPNTFRTIPCGHYQRGQQLEASAWIDSPHHSRCVDGGGCRAGERAGCFRRRDWASASMPLGQELILKGFPLWGDLSQYGFAPRIGCRYDCLRSHLNVIGR